MSGLLKISAVIVGVIIIAAIIGSLGSSDDPPRRAASSGSTTTTVTRAPAAPAPAPAPSPMQSVSGRGQAVKTVTLKEGRYTVTAEVTGNTDSGRPSNFAVWLRDRHGQGELIANEITASWSGQRAITVGSLFGLAAGTISVEVEYAESRAQWQVIIDPIR